MHKIIAKHDGRHVYFWNTVYSLNFPCPPRLYTGTVESYGTFSDTQNNFEL